MTHEWSLWAGVNAEDRTGQWVQLSVELPDLTRYGAKAFVPDSPGAGEFCTVGEARSVLLDGVARRVPMDFEAARAQLAQVAA